MTNVSVLADNSFDGLDPLLSLSRDYRESQISQKRNSSENNNGMKF